MLYITNLEFVERTLLDIEDVDDAIKVLDKVVKLLKRYGRNMLMNHLLKEIEDEKFRNLVEKLSNRGKLNVKDLTSIIAIVKEKRNDYTKSFRVNVYKGKEEEVENFLQSKFDKIEVVKKTTAAPECNVSGEGFSYKRSLDKDLDKLLK